MKSDNRNIIVRSVVNTALSTSSLLAILCGNAAHAADNEAKANDNQVQEIVVTAQFRAQNLQQTPLSITASSAEMLEARSQTGIAEVASHAPGVTMEAGGGAGGAQTTQINIRGIGQTDFNIALEPGVGIYVDDVYQGIMFASTPELLDLDRVEILRGPQGTLSGRNSIGGAIRLISKKPANETSGYVEGTYGSYNRTDLRAGFNFPIVGDRILARINGIAKQRDGYVTRLDYQCATGLAPAPVNAGSAATGSNCKLGTEGGQSVVALRGALRFIVSDAIEDTVTVDFTSDHSEPSANVLIRQGTWHGPGYNLLATPPVLNTPQNFVPPQGSFYNYANYTALIGSSGQYTLPAVSTARSWGVSNVLDVSLGGDISLKSITAWRKIETLSNVDTDASPLSRLLQSWSVDHAQFTQELRLNGKIGSLVDWTLGGFYYVGHSLQSGRINLDGAGDNGIPFYVPADFMFSDPIDVKSKAAFAHVEAHPLEGLNLTGGLRYTHDHKSYQFVRFLAPGLTPTLISAGVLPLNGLVGEYSGGRWDWRMALDYQIAQRVNVYAQVSTGFKGGGVNPRPYFPQQIRSFAPETVTAYEVGLKSDLFDRAMRLNVSAYINKYRDIQLSLASCPQYVPAGAPQNCALPANVGNATIKGVEIETEIHPVEGLSIDGTVSYSDFQFNSVDASTKVTLGMKPPYSPKWKAAAGVQYEIGLGSEGSLTPRFDYVYQSEVWSEAINTAANRIAGRGIANARLTYKHADGDWEVALGVTNLFDKYYFINLFERALPTTKSYQLVTGQPARPREWAISVKHRF